MGLCSLIDIHLAIRLARQSKPNPFSVTFLIIKISDVSMHFHASVYTHHSITIVFKVK